MMEKTEDGQSRQGMDELFDQVLAGIRSSGRENRVLGSESVMSNLDARHKVYYLLGNVLRVSTQCGETEGSQSLLN